MNIKTNSYHSIERNFLPFFDRLYALRDVVEACARLEEKYQLDGQMILFCCWLAMKQYRVLTPAHFQLLINQVMPWREKIVNNLKGLLKVFPRRHCNDELLEIYKSAIDNKRCAEKVELILLLRLIKNLEKQPLEGGTQANRATTNIFNYVSSQKISLHQTDLEKIYRIVRECFSED